MTIVAISGTQRCSPAMAKMSESENASNNPSNRILLITATSPLRRKPAAARNWCGSVVITDLPASSRSTGDFCGEADVAMGILSLWGVRRRMIGNRLGGNGASERASRTRHSLGPPPGVLWLSP